MQEIASKTRPEISMHDRGTVVRDIAERGLQIFNELHHILVLIGLTLEVLQRAGDKNFVINSQMA